VSRYGRRSFVDGVVSFAIGTGVIALIVGVLAGVILGIAAGVNHSDHVSCLRLHEQTGLETKYARSGINGECYIRVNERWVPKERWINVGDK